MSLKFDLSSMLSMGYNELIRRVQYGAKRYIKCHENPLSGLGN